MHANAKPPIPDEVTGIAIPRQHGELITARVRGLVASMMARAADEALSWADTWRKQLAMADASRKAKAAGASISWIFDDSPAPNAVSFRECCELFGYDRDNCVARIQAALTPESLQALRTELDKPRPQLGGSRKAHNDE